MQAKGKPTIEDLHANTVYGDCWEWCGDTTEKGYGRIERVIDGKAVTFRVHRISFEHYKGPIPEGKNACHTCDNPRCWNPAHLFDGTQADNMKDMRLKGRTQRGSQKKLAKLNEAQAVDIRRRLGEGCSQRKLASEFGVSRITIRDIGAGRSWKYAINLPAKEKP